MVSTTSFLNSGVYFLFGSSFGIVKHPTCYPVYTILSNKWGAGQGRDSIEETLTYCDFSSEHWTRIRTNNVIERLNREIRRRSRVVGSFPDGNSALMLVCAWLRHVTGTQWGNKKYMNMKHLEAALENASIVG